MAPTVARRIGVTSSRHLHSQALGARLSICRFPSARLGDGSSSLCLAVLGHMCSASSKVSAKKGPGAHSPHVHKAQPKVGGGYKRLKAT